MKGRVLCGRHAHKFGEGLRRNRGDCRRGIVLERTGNNRENLVLDSCNNKRRIRLLLVRVALKRENEGDEEK